jgi:hypothetical protein
LFAREAEIGEGDGVEVVVGEGDEAEADLAEVDDLVDDGLEGALTGLLAVGAPDAAEGAVLGAAADGLDGGPHVFVGGHEVPAGGEEFSAADAAACVDFFWRAAEAAGDGLAPGDVAISGDYDVGVAAFEGFFREERGVDATVDDPGSAFTGYAAYFIATEGVAGVDTDADDVAGLDGFGEDLLEGLVDEDGIACGRRCGCCKDEEPTRSDDCCPKGIVAGIYEMDAD